MATRYRVGNGFDFHPLEAGRRLVLGGVEIKHDKGLRGHSDADVVAHALANAILGAIGAGDLGRHFPDNDPKYKNADSIALLSTVWKLASDQGWQLGNADLTIFAEQPKLKPHLDAMRERLASALGSRSIAHQRESLKPRRLGRPRPQRRHGRVGNRDARSRLACA